MQELYIAEKRGNPKPGKEYGRDVAAIHSIIDIVARRAADDSLSLSGFALSGVQAAPALASSYMYNAQKRCSLFPESALAIIVAGMPLQRSLAGMLRRYFSFDGRISRKEFLYGLLEVFLFGLIFCLPITIIFAGVKSSDASEIIIRGISLVLLMLLSIGLWAQCALLVKRGHDRGLSGTPIFGALALFLFFIGNGALEVMGGESHMDLVFSKDRHNHLVFSAIFFAFGIYINFLFWSGLKKGSAAGAEEFGPPPTPDEEVGFWTLK